MAWSKTLSIVTPAGSDSPRGGDDRICELKAAFVERLNTDLYFPLDANQVSNADAGEHRKVTIRTLSADEISALAVAKAYIYRKAADGELYFKDASGNTIQLTKNGRINVGDTDIRLANNAYLKSFNAAGTGTVDLIKASTSDKPVLPDGSQLASDAAPTADAGIANKKYVVDTVAAAGGLFGEWDSTKVADTVYQAATDLLIHAYVTATDCARIQGYTGSSNPPTGNVALGESIYPYSSPNTLRAGLPTMAVKKGHYWKITTAGSIGTPVVIINVLPVGS